MKTDSFRVDPTTSLIVFFCFTPHRIRDSIPKMPQRNDASTKDIVLKCGSTLGFLLIGRGFRGSLFYKPCDLVNCRHASFYGSLFGRKIKGGKSKWYTQKFKYFDRIFFYHSFPIYIFKN